MSAPPPLDGVLLIDKPSGPTSHDVVARLRRVLGQRRIGHTGTLDPLASGLLAVVVGRATRLASILTGSDKTYEAAIRLGFATTTDDSLGERLYDTGSLKTPGIVCDNDILAALAHFEGTFDQRPPAHSAKKVAGVKAYELARRAEPVSLRAVPVTVRSLEWLDRTDDVIRLRITSGAGFYVRALARDLGERLGCGAHLTALRRIRSGEFRIEDALPLADAERSGRDLAGRLLSPAAALPQLAAVVLTEDGLRRVLHGQWVGPGHGQAGGPGPDRADARPAAPVKLLAPDDGRLVALAEMRAGALHPVVVLG